MGRGIIKSWIYNDPKMGDLVYVLEGSKHEIGLVIAIDGSPWHKHIQDWQYYILMPDGNIRKLRGWRVERIGSCED